MVGKFFNLFEASLAFGSNHFELFRSLFDRLQKPSEPEKPIEDPRDVTLLNTLGMIFDGFRVPVNLQMERIDKNVCVNMTFDKRFLADPECLSRLSMAVPETAKVMNYGTTMIFISGNQKK